MIEAIEMKDSSCKRSAFVEVTPEAIAAALSLPEGMDVFLVADGRYVKNNLMLRLTGAVGDTRLPLVQEGECIPVMSIHELCNSREAVRSA